MPNSIVEKNMQANVAQLPLADRLWVWFDTYKRQLALGAAVVVLAGLTAWFIIYQRDQKQVQAGAALSQVATAQLESPGQRTENADAYLKIVRDYPNSIAATRALLLAGGAFFADGKYSEAQAQFERFTREYQASSFMGEALLGIAACLDAEGKTDQAISAYKDLVTRHPNDSYVPQARFALARLYEAQGKPELARDLYQEVERSAPMTSLGNEAGVRMEELIAKNPSLAPAPPVPSAPSAAFTNMAPLLQKK
jgi:TolA-binding protein